MHSSNIDRHDYVTPVNPRGDGWQKPSSSSTGSAAACAAYPWIDFTVGTDTGGSIRHPAGVMGVYGFRSSLGLLDDAGVLSVSKRLDALGVFARSATVLEAAMNALMPAPPLVKSAVWKYKLLYAQRAPAAKPHESLKWFPHPHQPGVSPRAEHELEVFVQKLEAYLGCTRTRLNMDQLWRDTRPTGQPETLDEATGKLYTPLVYYQSIRKNIDPFIADYEAKNHGVTPWIDTIVRKRFDAARVGVSLEDYENALKQADIFSDWVHSELFKCEPDETPILIFPQSFGRPEYRDETPTSGETFFHSFSVYSLSYLGGGPDVTVPISEVPFVSERSRKREWLPVSLSMLGRKGEDGMILSLLAGLERDGVLREVEAGKRMFKKSSSLPHFVKHRREVAKLNSDSETEFGKPWRSLG